MQDTYLIEQFLDKLRDKVKISRKTGKAYLPLSIVYAINKEEDKYGFKGLPWIFGAYSDGGFNVMSDMQDTPLYGHLYWSNSNVILDNDFNIEDYLEHLVECSRCHQVFSDNYSDYAPTVKRDGSISFCSLCNSNEPLEKCNKNKDCKYEFKNEIECSDCFFNGGLLDPRMNEEENEINNRAKKSYYDRLKGFNDRQFLMCIDNKNWFGTLNKKYLLIDYEVLKIKDECGNAVEKTFVKINDDYGQEIQLPIDYFELSN